MNSKFSISVKDVRAIKEAEINLNGITVLSGENGCGKTTLAKILYGFIKTSSKFDIAISELYSRELTFATSLLRDFLPRESRFNRFPSDTDEMDAFSSGDFVSYNMSYKKSELYLAKVILPRIKLIRQKYDEKEYTITNAAFTRLFQLYNSRVREIKAKNIIELLNDYEQYILDLLQELTNLKKTHNLRVFNHQLLNYFNEDTDKWNYTFKEFGSNLIDRKNKTVVLQKSFSNAIYIDVPTVFDYDYYRIPSRGLQILRDLQEALQSNKEFAENKSISIIIEEVLNGQISRKDEMFSRIFYYIAKSGKSIPLSQAASGLKCFAVLERLYANGCLTDNTLLIVDEPEVHLHPKWIVEYARVLVFIQKYLHTTILVASHNPDMVSAIKYISEKEKCSDSLTFYIAQEVEPDDFRKFKFKNLNTDIEEIFASFNIALDRINLYGSFDND